MSKRTDPFALFTYAREGERRKIEGMTTVEANAGSTFMDAALRAVRAAASARPDLTMDDVKALYVGDQPHHPNAWGSVLPTAAKRGIVVGTDRYRKSTAPSAHARRIRVWERA